MEPDKIKCPKCGCGLSVSVEAPEDELADGEVEETETEETYTEPAKKEKGFGSVFSKVMNSGK